MTASQDDRGEDARFEALIERSSLGTPGAKQLRERIPMARKLVIAFDGSVGLGDFAQEVKRQIAGVLASALGEARVAPGSYEMQAQGDGGLALLPAVDGVDEPRLIVSLIDALDSGLRRVNEDLALRPPIRLRVALDEGGVYRTVHGYAGPSVTAVRRLCDAAGVRSMLRASGAQLVVVVTDHLYRGILAHAPGRTFIPVSLTTKQPDTLAWACLPGTPLTAAREPRGPGPLTSREQQIAMLVARGLSNRDISRRMGISPEAVIKSIAGIEGKLGLDSRAQIAAWAIAVPGNLRNEPILDEEPAVFGGEVTIRVDGDVAHTAANYRGEA
jgi:DNA-binding CsgD family transcriptional regulator